MPLSNIINVSCFEIIMFVVHCKGSSPVIFLQYPNALRMKRDRELYRKQNGFLVEAFNFISLLIRVLCYCCNDPCDNFNSLTHTSKTKAIHYNLVSFLISFYIYFSYLLYMRTSGFHNLFGVILRSLTPPYSESFHRRL